LYTDGEADVGDLVEALEFLHHQFADVAAVDFALAAGEQLFFDRGDRRIDRGRRHRPLAQRQHQAAAQLGEAYSVRLPFFLTMIGIDSSMRS
jgi:hypothetical protein